MRPLTSLTHSVLTTKPSVKTPAIKISVAEGIINSLRRNVSYPVEQQKITQMLRELKPASGQYIATLEDGISLYINAERPDRLVFRTDSDDVSYEMWPSHPLFETITAVIRKLPANVFAEVALNSPAHDLSLLVDGVLSIFEGVKIKPSSFMLNALYRLPTEVDITAFNQGECRALRYYFFFKQSYFGVYISRPEDGSPLRIMWEGEMSAMPTLIKRNLPSETKINRRVEQRLMNTPRPISEFCISPRTRGSSAEIVNYNANVHFTDNDKELIVCRHLALKYARDTLASEHGKVDLRQHYSSEDALSRHVEFTLEGDTDKLHNQMNCKVIDSDKFGTLLALLFTKMERENCTHLGFMIYLMENHAIAARLVIRNDEGDNGKRYVVSVYEPNFTGVTVSTRIRNLSELASPRHALGAYHPNKEKAQQILYRKPVGIQALNAISLPELPPALTPSISPQSIYFYLSVGDEMGLRICLEQIEKSGDAVSLLLQVNCGENAYTGLYTAMCRNNYNLVRVFIDGLAKLLKAGLITGHQAVGLATALSDGHPGLRAAMLFGCLKSVEVFIAGIGELVKAKYLTNEQAATLLKAEFEGSYALGIAIQHGKHEVVAAYIAGLKNLRHQDLITTGQVASLLRSKESSGENGLTKALRRGQDAILKAYFSGIGELVNAGYLTDKQAFFLLRPESTRSTGLRDAAPDISAETTLAYISALKNIFTTWRADREEIVSLLDSEAQNGMKLLFQIMQERSLDTVERFIAVVGEMVKAGILDDTKAINVLRSESLGYTALSGAMQSGDTKSVQQYITGLQHLLTSGLLSGDQAVVLLRADSQGLASLGAATSLGHHEVVKVFMTGVEELTKAGFLSDVQAALLLWAQSEGVPAFWEAMAFGHHETVTTYIAGIRNMLASGLLSGKLAAILLRGETVQGRKSLDYARMAGHQDVLKAFTTGVEDLAKSGYLSEKQAMELLADETATN